MQAKQFRTMAIGLVLCIILVNLASVFFFSLQSTRSKQLQKIEKAVSKAIPTALRAKLASAEKESQEEKDVAAVTTAPGQQKEMGQVNTLDIEQAKAKAGATSMESEKPLILTMASKASMPKMLAVVSNANDVKFVREVRGQTLPASVLLMREQVMKRLKECGKDKLSIMFKLTYTNTLETTTKFVNDGSVFVITGDIGLMWLRDSSAQVSHYMIGGLAKTDVQLQIIIEGVLKRQMHFISQSNPYANSYKVKFNNNPTDEQRRIGRVGYVGTRNYELDSHCYFLRLSYMYWKEMQGLQTDVFDSEWVGTVKTIVDLMEVEQYHEEKSKYRHDLLLRNGLGSPVTYTGMTWTGFRPSDDACKFHYLIPANAFAVTTLEYAVEILKSMPSPDLNLAQRAAKLADQIDEGIHKYGTKDVPGYGKIYAYEVDGMGGQNFMDDANVPSLLSLQYLGYETKRDPSGQIAKNTRKWVLSKENRFMINAKYKGIGSPHTAAGSIWPMSLIVEILTTSDREKILELFDTLQATDAGTNLMHESFNGNNPSKFTREWFAWANSLFSEAVIAKLDVVCPANK